MLSCDNQLLTLTTLYTHYFYFYFPSAHGRLLMLRQQYHTLQERRRFIEMSMQNITEPHSRRVSMPLPPLPH